LPGISENIRVISIVDRFLEHSRIFYFHNNGDTQVYIGSADWMDRNLSRRVEVVFPIEHTELKNRLVHEILAIGLADNLKARELLPDGTYRRVHRKSDQPFVRSQERFLEIAAQAAERRMMEIPPPPPVLTAPPKARSSRKRPAKAASERAG
jgi:polyphosphate kinase